MCTLAAPVCVRICNECLFKNRLDDIANGMVNHPVAEGSSGYQAVFGFIDFECPIGAGEIRSVGKFFLKQKQLSL